MSLLRTGARTGHLILAVALEAVYPLGRLSLRQLLSERLGPAVLLGQGF